MAKGRKRQSLEDKLKDLDPNFLDELQSLDSVGLTDKLVKLVKYQEEINQAKKDDIDLQRIIEQKRVAEEVYKTNLQALKLKVSFIVKRLKEKGQE